MSEDLYGLKQLILDFITDLRSVFTRRDEKADLTIVEIFYKNQHVERVMDDAIKKLLPHKEKIKNKDLDFFRENRYIFGDLPDDRILHYQDIITSNKISREDIENIWSYLELMIVYSENYKKQK